jgi:hypothetical protein
MDAEKVGLDMLNWMNDMHTLRFNSTNKAIWDKFVTDAKNGHFMFLRDYMDYHSERFRDHSLMVVNEKGKLVAIFPANQLKKELISHQGLSFGGILTNLKMDTLTFLNCLDSIIEYCLDNSITSILYKKLPHIYNITLSEEDTFALIYKGAKLERRDLSSALDLKHQPGLSKTRLRNVRKALKENVSCHKSDDLLQEFHSVLVNNLARVHDLKPVHSYDELRILTNKFPDNICLYYAFHNGELLAGVLLFITSNVAHAQYIASNEVGRKLGALDLLFDHLIKKYGRTHAYFSFGVSTEDSGQRINEGLVFQKESFGSRAYVHDFYRLNL